MSGDAFALKRALDDLARALALRTTPASRRFVRDLQQQGACRGWNTELFFRDDFNGEDYEPASVREARRICQPCPIRRECLEYAYDTGTYDGVFGGSTGDERWRFRDRGDRLEALMVVSDEDLARHSPEVRVRA